MCKLVKGPTKAALENISRAHRLKKRKESRAWRRLQRKLFDPRPRRR